MKWLASIVAYLAVGIGIFRFQNAWGALLGFHIAIITSLLIAQPSIPIKSLLTNNHIKWIFISVVLAAGSGCALHFLWNSLDFASDLKAQVEALGLNSANWVPFIAYFAMVNPWVEEYFWRGFLGSKTPNLYISDFLYSGFHALILMGKTGLGTIVLALTVLVAAGWFWRQIARLDCGLLAPVLGHMAADLTILLAVYWNV